MTGGHHSRAPFLQRPFYAAWASIWPPEGFHEEVRLAGGSLHGRDSSELDAAQFAHDLTIGGQVVPAEGGFVGGGGGEEGEGVHGIIGYERIHALLPPEGRRGVKP